MAYSELVYTTQIHFKNFRNFISHDPQKGGSWVSDSARAHA